MNERILDIKNLSVRFQVDNNKTCYPALNRINFHVNKNEVVGIIGESGSGKSITLLSILGLLPTNPGIISGEILFNSDENEINTLEDINQYVDITDFETSSETITKKTVAWNKLQRKRYKNILGKQVSLVFQNPKLAFNPYFSIGKQISESILIHIPNSTKESAKALAIKWLARVKMDSPSLRYNNNPHGLSGGLCQRAMIAMALASNPQLLIADEPTTGLDATIQGDILSLLASLKHEENLSMIIVSHDFNVMNRLADRVLVYYKGFIIEEGLTKNILDSNSNNHHPYTALLLNTEFDEETESEENIKSDLSEQSFFNQCPYASICKHKTHIIANKCDTALPPLISIKNTDSQKIRCWRFEK